MPSQTGHGHFVSPQVYCAQASLGPCPTTAAEGSTLRINVIYTLGSRAGWPKFAVLKSKIHKLLLQNQLFFKLRCVPQQYLVKATWRNFTLWASIYIGSSNRNKRWLAKLPFSGTKFFCRNWPVINSKSHVHLIG